MHYTIELLMHSTEHVQEYYVTAKQKWQELLQDLDTIEIEDFAKRITTAQIWFEHNCGGRYVGQEVMAWSALGFYYTTRDGFGDNSDLVQKLAKGFEKSSCSLEVKYAAKDAASSYDISIQWNI